MLSFACRYCQEEQQSDPLELAFITEHRADWHEWAKQRGAELQLPPILVRATGPFIFDLEAYDRMHLGPINFSVKRLNRTTKGKQHIAFVLGEQLAEAGPPGEPTRSRVHVGEIQHFYSCSGPWWHPNPEAAEPNDAPAGCSLAATTELEVARVSWFLLPEGRAEWFNEACGGAPVVRMKQNRKPAFSLVHLEQLEPRAVSLIADSPRKGQFQVLHRDWGFWL